MNCHIVKRGIGHLLLNCRQNVTVPALVTAEDLTVAEKTHPPMETNVGIEPGNYDLEESLGNLGKPSIMWF